MNSKLVLYVSHHQCNGTAHRPLKQEKKLRSLVHSGTIVMKGNQLKSMKFFCEYFFWSVKKGELAELVVTFAQTTSWLPNTFVARWGNVGTLPTGLLQTQRIRRAQFWTEGIILDPPRMNSFTKQTQSQILFTFDGNKAAYYIILAYIGMLFAPAAGQTQNSWITSQSACLKIRSGRWWSWDTPELKSQWSWKHGMISMVFNTGLLLKSKSSRAEKQVSEGDLNGGFFCFGPSICSLSLFPSICDLVPLVTPSWVVSHPLWTKVPKWSSSLEIYKCAVRNFLLPTSELCDSIHPNRYAFWWCHLRLSWLMMLRSDSVLGSKDTTLKKPLTLCRGTSLEFLPHFLKQVKLKDSSNSMFQEKGACLPESPTVCVTFWHPSRIALEL